MPSWKRRENKMSNKKTRDYRHPLCKRLGTEPIRPLVVSKLAAKRRGDKMKVRMLPFRAKKHDIAAIVEETRRIIEEMIRMKRDVPDA